MKGVTLFLPDSVDMWHGIMTDNLTTIIVGAILDPIPGTRNGQNKSPPSASRLFCFRSAFVLQSQHKIALTGTLCYKPKPSPEKGEGLVLEEIASLEKTSTLSMRQPEKRASEMVVSIPSEPMDDDMAEDVFKLAEALDTGFLDVQADAATAIAGLSSDGKAGSHLPLSDLFPPQDWNIRWLHLFFFFGQLVNPVS